MIFCALVLEAENILDSFLPNLPMKSAPVYFLVQLFFLMHLWPLFRFLHGHNGTQQFQVLRLVTTYYKNKVKTLSLFHLPAVFPLLLLLHLGGCLYWSFLWIYFLGNKRYSEICECFALGLHNIRKSCDGEVWNDWDDSIRCDMSFSSSLSNLHILL